ncbi:YybH family protein [Kordiimonas sp.]|uniref:YybH family protein n=1 Tax=Kordiimonas sp. TaxID=1970157 RepID=UPI003A92F48B
MKKLRKEISKLAVALVSLPLVYFLIMGWYTEAPDQNSEISRLSNQGGPKIVNTSDPSAVNTSLRAFMEQFYSALHNDDFQTVSGAFSSDATIFENGLREPSLADYLDNHLKPEMVVMKSANRQILVQEASLIGDGTLVTTSSLLSFSVEGKQVDIQSVETLFLVKDEGHWKIQHAHWSSRPASK